MARRDAYVSPYLRRSPRSFEQVMRDRVERVGNGALSEEAKEAPEPSPTQKKSGDVEPR